MYCDRTVKLDELFGYVFSVELRSGEHTRPACRVRRPRRTPFLHSLAMSENRKLHRERTDSGSNVSLPFSLFLIHSCNGGAFVKMVCSNFCKRLR